ncbi:MAG: hypothetical protein BWY25_02491 [Chloroflexi bacterium ADurb.Bin222]|nr:MAG: hypothetical protein BWY25_02491 [Chloroflexi bacterium ADurb.Bin222]
MLPGELGRLFQPALRRRDIPLPQREPSQLRVELRLHFGEGMRRQAELRQPLPQPDLCFLLIALFVPYLPQLQHHFGRVFLKTFGRAFQGGPITGDRFLIIANMLVDVAQADVGLPTFHSIGLDMLRQLQGTAVIVQRFPVGKALTGAIPCQQQILERFAALTGAIVVQGEHLHVRRQIRRVQLLDCLGDVAMEQGPLAPQQAAVDRLLGQNVAERIDFLFAFMPLDEQSHLREPL